MFALLCQKKFQVVQSVTALFDLRGGGRSGVRSGVQMGGRAGRNPLWRASAPGRKSERSPGQARLTGGNASQENRAAADGYGPQSPPTEVEKSADARRRDQCD